MPSLFSYTLVNCLGGGISSANFGLSLLFSYFLKYKFNSYWNNDEIYNNSAKTAVEGLESYYGKSLQKYIAEVQRSLVHESNEIIEEATDINDPVLVAMRAMHGHGPYLKDDHSPSAVRYRPIPTDANYYSPWLGPFLTPRQLLDASN